MDYISVGAKMVSILLKGAYSKHMEWKFERLEERARLGGMSIEDLIASDDRFAVFMRVARAFEHCSNKEVVDFLTDAMIGSIKSGDLEDKPDFVQMAISALSGITKTELYILSAMHRHQVYLDMPVTANNQENRESFIKDCEETLGIESDMLSAITNGLGRSW